MGVKSYVKNTVKNNFNIKAWLSWNSVKENTEAVTGIARDLKNTANPVTITGTFEDAMQRLGWTESDIQSRMRAHLFAAGFCAFLGILAFVWMIFLLTKTMYLSGLMAFSIFVLMFSYAFREHLNYFQLKHRKLRCTVNEWFLSFRKK